VSLATEVVLLRKLGGNKVICPIFIRVKDIPLIYYKNNNSSNLSVDFLFEVKKVFALKGQHKPARRNAAG
jgi:hypothetical protein